MAAAEHEPEPLPEPTLTPAPTAPTTVVASAPEESAVPGPPMVEEDADEREAVADQEDAALGALGADTRWSEANAYYAAQSYSAALGAYESFIDASAPSDPRVADARFYIGASLYRLGNIEGAQSALRDFLARHPGHARASDAQFILDEIQSDEDAMIEAPANRALQPSMDSFEESYR